MKHIPKAYIHQQVHTKAGGTHASYSRSLKGIGCNKWVWLDKRGRESLLEDQEKAEQGANTNHSERGRGIEACYTPTEKMVQALIHTTRSLRTTFRKYKVRVATDGPMEEMLKLSGNEGRLAKWAAELRTYDISFIREKEVKGPVMKRFCRQGEQVLIMPDANEVETSKLALLARLVASAGKGMKDLHVFIDSQILVDQVEGTEYQQWNKRRGTRKR
ncbi:reverse transcriptase domain-containing protein [Tanacetum coccineum]|uniref:Reverse transcriptase domain-containing protein n=1 Tax=Tanacetum coccineum TaxID=301880 RepID=A0ABQ5EQY6_9ASTR